MALIFSTVSDEVQENVLHLGEVLTKNENSLVLVLMRPCVISQNKDINQEVCSVLFRFKSGINW